MPISSSVRELSTLNLIFRAFRIMGMSVTSDVTPV